MNYDRDDRVHINIHGLLGLSNYYLFIDHLPALSNQMSQSKVTIRFTNSKSNPEPKLKLINSSKAMTKTLRKN